MTQIMLWIWLRLRRIRKTRKAKGNKDIRMMRWTSMTFRPKCNLKWKVTRMMVIFF